jgi:CheY-like chemotaxis protein
MVELLELREFEVHAVESAEEALARLEEGIRPDVIVLDRRMPGMSGDDLLQRLKSDPVWARIPVAMVTGVPHRAGEPGMEPDAYLEKPFEVDMLDEALTQLGAS